MYEIPKTSLGEALHTLLRKRGSQKVYKDEKRDIKMPEGIDLGLKIVSKAEALWTDLKNRTQHSIEQIEKEMTIQKAVLEMCESKLQTIALNESD